MQRASFVAIGSLSLALLVTAVIVVSSLPSRAPPQRLLIAPGAQVPALYVLFAR